ncbi:hypothetical protein Tco_0577042 [Tanacetum coccineum]
MDATTPGFTRLCSINTPSFTDIQAAFITLLHTHYYTPSRLSQLLTLTPELGPGVLPGARLTCRSFLLSGSVEGGGPKGTDDREETPPPLTKEQIEGHVSALKSLIKIHNQRNKGDPIRLDFESEDTEVQDLGIAKGKDVMDEDLRKPFKEA